MPTHKLKVTMSSVGTMSITEKKTGLASGTFAVALRMHQDSGSVGRKWMFLSHKIVHLQAYMYN
jgi:hypothetical protein